MSYPFNIISTPGVTVTGTNGAALAQGEPSTSIRTWASGLAAGLAWPEV